MADNPHSLIQKAAEQLTLGSSAEMPAERFLELESKGDFTGERLFVQKPEVYQAIIALSAEGIGQIKIGTIMGVSPNTVRAVQRREGVSIDIVKKGLAELCHAGARLALEGINEDLSDRLRRLAISTKDKAIVAGVLVEKGQLLAGEATARVEVTELQKPDHDAFNAYVSNLKSANAMSLGGGSLGEKGNEAGDLGADQEAVTDMQSEVKSAEVVDNQQEESK